MVGVSSAITAGLVALDVVPGSVAEVLVRAVFNLVVIVLSVTMVWSMVWGHSMSPPIARAAGVWRSSGYAISSSV